MLLRTCGQLPDGSVFWSSDLDDPTVTGITLDTELRMVQNGIYLGSKTEKVYGWKYHPSLKQYTKPSHLPFSIDEVDDLEPHYPSPGYSPVDYIKGFQQVSNVLNCAKGAILALCAAGVVALMTSYPEAAILLFFVYVGIKALSFI